MVTILSSLMFISNSKLTWIKQQTALEIINVIFFLSFDWLLKQVWLYYSLAVFFFNLPIYHSQDWPFQCIASNLAVHPVPFGFQNKVAGSPIGLPARRTPIHNRCPSGHVGRSFVHLAEVHVRYITTLVPPTTILVAMEMITQVLMGNQWKLKAWYDKTHLQYEYCLHFYFLIMPNNFFF